MACGLGIAMDMVTAHVAVEYFTVHHPHVLDSTSPVAMALYWGVAAAWWFGAGAGVVLVWLNSRRAHPLPPEVIRKEMIWACIVLWVTLMLILASCYGLIGLIPMKARRATFDFDRRIMAVALTHLTEYVLGAIVLVVVAVRLNRIAAQRASS